MSVDTINDVKITRGDTFEADIPVTSSDGTIFDVTDFTVIIAVAKGSPSLDPVIIIQEDGSVTDGPGGIIHVEIPKEKTALLSPGSYKYDVQITSQAGKVYTVVRYATMEVGQSIAP